MLYLCSKNLSQPILTDVILIVYKCSLEKGFICLIQKLQVNETSWELSLKSQDPLCLIWLLYIWHYKNNNISNILAVAPILMLRNTLLPPIPTLYLRNSEEKDI